MRRFTKLALSLSLFVFTNIASVSAFSSKCIGDPTPLVDLVSEPAKYLGKKIVLEGEFYAFSTLALDYEPAMRNSKDFIGIVLARPDHEEIPLVELKLAAPLKIFKDNSISLEHGHKVLVKGKVYAVALGEPWIDIEEFSVVE